MLFPNTTGKKSLAAAATALTSSYVGAVMSAGPEGEHNALGILVKYVKGDETSIQLKVESSNDPTSTASGSVLWYQQVTEATNTGTVTLVPAIYTMAASDAASTQYFTFLITPVKGQQYKVSWKSTGGTPTGTIQIDAILGWV